LISLPGLPEPLPALVLPQRSSSSKEAWRDNSYHTVQLTAPLAALRVHHRAGGGAAAARELAWGSGTQGRWFAIGDIVLTRSEYAARYALPGSFSHQDEWQFPAGTAMNVGIAGPLFGYPGGELQAEWLSGPPPERRRLHGFWINRSGSA